MQRSAKFALIVSLLLISSIPMASATITSNYNIPKIDQWTGAGLSAGIYQNITRINGVWYVDGNIYPAPLNSVAPNDNSGELPNTDPNTGPEPTDDTTNPNSTEGPNPSSTQKPFIKDMPSILPLFGVAFLFLIVIGGFVIAKGSKKRSGVQWKDY